MKGAIDDIRENCVVVVVANGFSAHAVERQEEFMSKFKVCAKIEYTFVVNVRAEDLDQARARVQLMSDSELGVVGVGMSRDVVITPDQIEVQEELPL